MAPLFVLAACDNDATQENAAVKADPQEKASSFPSASSGSLISPGGNALGKVEVSEKPDGVALRIAARGLQPGTHGLKLHATGKCQGPNFASAGQPQANARELQPVTVESDGVLERTVTLPGARLASLRDADGSSLVVHMNADAAPSGQGDAGNRIGCVVL